MANKIHYGLKNVYYAIATIANDGTATYGNPVAFPGAVSLNLDPQEDSNPFYADNIVYYAGSNNRGYEGELEMALLTSSFEKDILGYAEDNKSVLYESVNNDLVHFALMFQFEGDEKAIRHVIYNCTAGRPTLASETKGENVEPKTATVPLTASSVYNASVGKDIVKAKTDENTDATAYDGWFSAVYEVVAPSA